MSYIERTLWSFLKNKIVGGYQVLRKRDYVAFFLIILVLVSVNTILMILDKLAIIPIPIDLLNILWKLQLLVALGFIISGLVVGNREKSDAIYFIGSFLIIGGISAIFLIFNVSYDNFFFLYTKLIFFLSWVIISTISMFFVNLYFFTSFPKKLITLGIPKDHIFFGGVIKAVVLGISVVYLYMIYNLFSTVGDLSGFIIGFLGFVSSALVLYLLQEAPKHAGLDDKEIEKRKKNNIKIPTQKKAIPGIINFATAIGFFYSYLIYHLFTSFTTSSESILTLTIEIGLLGFNMLNIIQGQARSITRSKSRPKLFENQVEFQSRVYFVDRVRSIVGQKGLILIIMGLVLGYHVSFMDSYYSTNLPFFNVFISPGLKMSAIYHRVFLFFAFVLVITSILVFFKNKQFQNFMTDKYTFTQVLKYIGGFFQRGDDGIPSPIEQGIQNLGKKIQTGVAKWSERFANKPQNKENKDKPENNNQEDAEK